MKSLLLEPPSDDKADRLLGSLRRIITDWKFDRAMAPPAAQPKATAAAAAARMGGGRVRFAQRCRHRHDFCVQVEHARARTA